MEEQPHIIIERIYAKEAAEPTWSEGCEREQQASEIANETTMAAYIGKGPSLLKQWMTLLLYSRNS